MDISKIFEKYIEQNKNYKTAYDIVQKNSIGKIWLIGGALSRNMNQLIHKTPQDSFDFDFIVEEKNDKINLPKGWTIKENKFGNPKFIGENISIDFIPMKTFESIIRNDLKPTIENILSKTPFTIQALAYDTETKKIIGESGLRAFEKKIFEVNSLEDAKILADKKGIELNDLISKKAKSMGFKAVLI
ncbi:hypothetical protein KAS08_05145 [Candidatus Pacearchaeota archaeon]|nr:hypothetical protein [Candidatus Pacearchaeota archaeon]